MKPSSDLEKLHRQLKYRMAQLRNVVHRRKRDAFSQDTEARISYVTIEMLNSWANFSRSFFVSCVTTATTTSGKKIRPAVTCRSMEDAIERAVKSHSPKAKPKPDGSWDRRAEPTWHDPDVLIRLCRNEGLSNLADIEAALSTNNRTFRELRSFRNYFAHRNDSTERTARRLAQNNGIQSSLRPSQILLARAYRRHQALVFDWLDHIQFTAEALCH